MEDLSNLTQQLRIYERRRDHKDWSVTWNDQLETIHSSRSGEEEHSYHSKSSQQPKRFFNDKHERTPASAGQHNSHWKGKKKMKHKVGQRGQSLLRRQSTIDSLMEPEAAAMKRHPPKVAQPGDFTVGGVQGEYRHRKRVEEKEYLKRSDIERYQLAARKRVKEHKKKIKYHDQHKLELSSRIHQQNRLSSDNSNDQSFQGAAEVSLPDVQPQIPSKTISGCYVLGDLSVQKHCLDDDEKFSVARLIKNKLKSGIPVVLQAPLEKNMNDDGECTLVLMTLYMRSLRFCKDPAPPPIVFDKYNSQHEILLEPNQRYKLCKNQYDSIQPENFVSDVSFVHLPNL